VLVTCAQATGEDYSVEPADERRPFRALLDVGLIRTTTGNRVFGALKVFGYTCAIKFGQLMGSFCYEFTACHPLSCRVIDKCSSLTHQVHLFFV
jgi:hypothetical protein